ncbi:hypothetical protein [Horticoccus sp. 23ND18S-11]|uniref:hypothetical protein n=1 Tax=Horticoccus sp. 23ND18S-11 TaxID=3391832 RepID=UPI0039C9371D
MKSCYRSLLATASAIAALASAASLNAVTVNFAFTVSGGDVTTVTKASSPTGLTATVTAWSTADNGANWTQESITQNGSYGMGVRTDSYDSHTVDNSSRKDFLLFSFGGTSVDVNSVTFGYVDGDSDFRWSVGNSNSLSSLFSSGTDVNGVSYDPVTFNINAGNTLGQYLLIGAKPGDTNDRFKVSGLNVSYSERSTNTPGVPDGGSTVILMGSALAGLGLIARRRTAA